MNLDIGCGIQFRGDVNTDIKYPCNVMADAHSLPFRSQAFDKAILNHVLEHCQSPERVLDEAVRVAHVVEVVVPHAFHPYAHVDRDHKHFFTSEWFRQYAYARQIKVVGGITLDIDRILLLGLQLTVHLRRWRGKDIQVSACLPVGKNDHHFLEYAKRGLPSGFHEVIFLYDSGEGTWRFHIGEVFEQAFSQASGNYLFSLGVDILCDPHMLTVAKQYFREGFDLVSFEYQDYSLGKRCQWHECLMNLLRKLPFTYNCRLGKWSGIYAMKREVWETIHYKDVPSPDLQFFNDCAAHGFRHKYVSGLSIYHLRSGVHRLKQFGQGECRALLGVHPLKVFAHALFYVKPWLLVGYLKRRLAK